MVLTARGPGFERGNGSVQQPVCRLEKCRRRYPERWKDNSAARILKPGARERCELYRPKVSRILMPAIIASMISRCQGGRKISPATKSAAQSSAVFYGRGQLNGRTVCFLLGKHQRAATLPCARTGIPRSFTTPRTSGASTRSSSRSVGHRPPNNTL